MGGVAVPDSDKKAEAWAAGGWAMAPRARCERWPLTMKLILALGAALVLGACGSSGNGPSNVEVRPIEEILVGEIRVVDVSPTGGLVQVETSVPVVCSVVFGKDSSYGDQATDMDMGGGAHSQHAAVLRGLEPDTEYHYRLQGSDASGALYVSEDMTFRTASAEASTEQGENLAASAAGARVVDTSSTFGDSDSWRPENAIDGDPATEWSTAGDGDDAFLEIELVESADIGAVGAWTRTMGASGEITTFRVLTDTGEVLGPFDLSDTSTMQVFTVDVTAQRLRFEAVSSTGGNTGFVEVAAYPAD